MARAAEWWRGRRLDLASLPAGERAVTVLGLATAAVMAVLVAAQQSGWEPARLAGETAVSPLLVTVALCGLAVAAALLTWAAASPGWRLRRAVWLGVAVLGLVVSGVSAGPGIAALLWIGTVGPLALAASPGPVVVAHRARYAALAAFPFGVAAFVAAVQPRIAPAAAPTVMSALVLAITSMAVVVGALQVWLAVEAVRASRDLGVWASSRVAPERLLAVLLALKVTWLTFGYLAASFPLGAGWERSRRDGAVEWLLAALFALASAALLAAHRRLRVDEGAFAPAALALVGGFFAGLFLQVGVGLAGLILLPSSRAVPLLLLGASAAVWLWRRWPARPARRASPCCSAWA